MQCGIPKGKTKIKTHYLPAQIRCGRKACGDAIQQRGKRSVKNQAKKSGKRIQRQTQDAKADMIPLSGHTFPDKKRKRNGMQQNEKNSQRLAAGMTPLPVNHFSPPVPEPCSIG